MGMNPGLITNILANHTQTMTDEAAQQKAAAAAIANLNGPAIINDAINSIINAGATMGHALQPMGATFLGAAFAYVIAYETLMIMAGNGSPFQSFAKMIEKCIHWAIISWVFAHYDTVGSWASTASQSISSALGLGSTSIGDLAVKMYNTAVAVLLGNTTSGGATSSSTSMTDLPFSSFIPALLSMLFRLVTAFLILVAGVIFVGQLILSQVMLSLGLALGYLFIPCALLKRYESYFSGWEGFMISAALWKVVGAAVFLMMAHVFDPFAKDMSEAVLAGDYSIVFEVGCAEIFIALVAGMLMMQIPSIVNSLTSGRSGPGMESQLAYGYVAGRMASSAARTAGGAASMGYRGGAAGGRAGVAGAKSITRGARLGGRAFCSNKGSNLSKVGSFARGVGRVVGRDFKSGVKSSAVHSVRAFHNKAMGRKAPQKVQIVGQPPSKSPAP